MAAYGNSVFINCPFDKDFEPILQSILFCVIYLGFDPRISLASNDSGDIRLPKIQKLIENSRYSIHDLSRCKSKAADEYFRLNMPFELGMDYFCRQRFKPTRPKKSILVLEKEPFRYQAALSDLSGCDIKHHKDEPEMAIEKVREWLVVEAGANSVGASKIKGGYIDFQEWNYEKQIADGFSEEDIQKYPTAELLRAMKKWMKLGKPASAN
ncbi:MAG: hypothetical protein RLN85_21355 [Pseudomonadales bacterium]